MMRLLLAYKRMELFQNKALLFRLPNVNAPIQTDPANFVILAEVREKAKTDTNLPAPWMGNCHMMHLNE